MKSPLERESERLANYLAAENKSPKTIKSYLEAVRILDRFLFEHGLPGSLEAITREHMTAFVQYQIDRWRPATALNRYRSLTVFFNWLVDEGEIPHSPMMRMRPPKVESEPPAVLTEDEIRALLKACEGSGFRERRDMAMISLLLDTGMRREELATITMTDLEPADRMIRILGKGSRVRYVRYARQAARDVDRYLRVRERHPDAELSALWLGTTGRGGITGDGVGQIVEYRAQLAGIGHVHPHQFRHSFAHYWKLAGGQEGDLMRLGGWRSKEIMARYGSQLADQRAHEAHAEFSPRDRF